MPSSVTLGQQFFEGAITRPVPVDMRAHQRLLDLYCRLTYRHSSLRKDVAVPWEAIPASSGPDYGRFRKFREEVREALADVIAVYPDGH